jgi:CO/xanthine dehydrogenase Mo-binding subunit/aerobic-type carbon monoxide dehydrogenase small subunit (CoxS/CutS family)
MNEPATERPVLSKVEGIELWVNGQAAAAPAGLSLLRFLRDNLRLTGAKDGCSTGHCGACTVIVNGVAQRACLLKMEKLTGARIETIEGLAQDGTLHPLQEAFIAHGAVQCGFCTPGMIMTARALLDRNPTPSAADIRRALTRNHNLCRCTGYVKIIRAIQDAARHVAAGQPYPATRETANATQLRRDALKLVAGRMQFADDMMLPNMLYGKVRWADHPAARILAVDTAAAQAMPGVVAVLTAADVPGRNAFGRIIPDQPAFASDVVRYIGDPVACAFAETAAAAEEACRLVQVNYEPLPGIFSPAAAAQPDARRLHEKGNLLKESRVRRGQPEEAFTRCAIVVEGEYTTPFVEHGYLEPEAGLGIPDADGGVTLWMPTQAAWDDRRELAAILALPREKVRVKQLPIGGAFGAKGDVHLHRFLALGALRTGRPVKMTLTRQESLRTHAKRHASTMHVKVGANADGAIQALQTRVVLDGGAYASTSGGILEAGCVINTGPYFVPNLDLHGQVWYTNNIIGGAMRGFGAPKIAFAIESALDELARRLGLDPFELRLRNALDAGLPNMVDHVQEPGVATIKPTIIAAREALQQLEIPQSSGTKRIGIGVAAMTKTVGVGRGTSETAGAIVELDAQGDCHVYTGYCEMGQGAVPMLLGLVAGELGLPVERVHIVLPDTSRAPETSPSTASRQAFMTGNATVLAARELRAELRHRAADSLGAEPPDIRIEGAALVDAASGRRMLLADLGERFVVERQYRPPATEALPPGGQSTWGTPEFQSRATNWCYDYGTHVAIVEVDTATGAVRVLKYIAVHDVGKALNRAAIEGQIEGGVMMGLGYALSEEFIVHDGVNLTDSLHKCGLPTADQTPEIISVVLEVPHPLGPLGAKGFAEAPTVPVAPAILNAIYDAVGVRITSLPATREKVLAGLRRSVISDQ